MPLILETASQPNLAEIVLSVAAVLGALGVIIGAFMKIHTLLTKFESVEKHNKEVDIKLKDMEAEQCMQTYVLEAVLDGLHQLGCNGKTTEASEKLSKFINKKAHNQKIEE